MHNSIESHSLETISASQSTSLPNTIKTIFRSIFRNKVVLFKTPIYGCLNIEIMLINSAGFFFSLLYYCFEYRILCVLLHYTSTLLHIRISSFSSISIRIRYKNYKPRWSARWQHGFIINRVDSNVPWPYFKRIFCVCVWFPFIKKDWT